jgi:hypothetical protein
MAILAQYLHFVKIPSLAAAPASSVFEKLWILDTAVVGCELSEPFVELLTVEAQLALIEQEREREATYYRRRETIMSLSHLSGSWERPFIELLHGMLAIDTKRTPYPALALSA